MTDKNESRFNNLHLGVNIDHVATFVVYEPEIEIAASGDFEADVRRVTALCTTKLEGWIRFRPELWLWMHRRWKTVPAGGSQQQAAGEETISR